MTNMRKIMIALVVASLALSIVWISLAREKEISGDNLKILFLKSIRKTYSSWYLYYEDQRKYCLSYSRPIVPIRYCVPKSDLEIRNARDLKGSEIGYVGMGELVLKENRRPGLSEEIF